MIMVVNNELSCVLSVPVEQPPADGWSLDCCHAQTMTWDCLHTKAEGQVKKQKRL